MSMPGHTRLCFLHAMSRAAKSRFDVEGSGTQGDPAVVVREDF
jgi:hypothetical protein